MFSGKNSSRERIAADDEIYEFSASRDFAWNPNGDVLVVDPGGTGRVLLSKKGISDASLDADSGGPEFSWRHVGL
jgi:hypothetical protein